METHISLPNSLNEPIIENESSKNASPMQEPVLGDESFNIATTLQVPVLENETPIQELLLGNESFNKATALQVPVLENESFNIATPLNATLLQNESSINTTPLNATLLRNESSINTTPLNATLLQNESSINTTPLNATLLQNESSINTTPLNATLLQNESFNTATPLNATLLQNETPLQEPVFENEEVIATSPQSLQDAELTAYLTRSLPDLPLDVKSLPVTPHQLIYLKTNEFSSAPPLQMDESVQQGITPLHAIQGPIPEHSNATTSLQSVKQPIWEHKGAIATQSLSEPFLDIEDETAPPTRFVQEQVLKIENLVANPPPVVQEQVLNIDDTVTTITQEPEQEIAISGTTPRSVKEEVIKIIKGALATLPRRKTSSNPSLQANESATATQERLLSIRDSNLNPNQSLNDPVLHEKSYKFPHTHDSKSQLKTTWSSSWFNQLKVMTKRSFILITRHYIASISQSFLAPIIFITLLFLLQRLYVIRETRENLYPTPYQLSGVPLCQGNSVASPCFSIMFTPDNSITRLIMRTFAEINGQRIGSTMQIESSPLSDFSPPTTRGGIVPVSSTDFIYKYVLQNPNTTQFAIAFQSTAPSTRYQIWFNATQSTNGTDIYDGQLLSLQRGIDEAILSIATTTPNSQSPPISIPLDQSAKLNVELKDWPTAAPDFVPDVLVTNFGPMFFFCSVMVIFIAVLQDIVTEKELFLRHAMATAGLHSSVYWISTYITRSLLVFIASITTIIMGHAYGFDVFSRSNFFVMLLIFFLFGIAMLSFAFFITSFCHQSRVAVLIGIFIFVVGLLFESIVFSAPFTGYIWYDTSAPSSFQYIFACLPFFNFGKIFLDVSLSTTGRFDRLTQSSIPGPGFTFSALYIPIPETQLPIYDSRVPSVPLPISTLWTLVLNAVVYLFLAWYLELILPDHYGQCLPPHFIFTRQFWGIKDNRERILDDFIEKNKPLSSHPDFAVLNEDSDVAQERSLAFDKSVDAAVRIGNLQKVYYNSSLGSMRKHPLDKMAVRSVCLTLQTGQLLALLGQNGAGKSTIISCLSGLTNATAGGAILFEKSITSDMDEIRHRLGICPQHDILFNNLNAVEHIELFGGIKNLTRSEIDILCEDRLRSVRLWKVKAQPIATYSGGMKRRLSVVISTIGDPDILFLDEPTTGMDPVNRRSVWAFLEKFKKGRVVILTTHAMEEADALGDKICIMANGQLKAISSNVALKNKFGMGYRIGLTSKSGQVDNVKAFIDREVPEAVLEDDSAGALMYRVPQSFVKRVPAFVKAIESLDGKQLVESWGLSQPTLEEIFLGLIRESK